MLVKFPFRQVAETLRTLLVIVSGWADAVMLQKSVDADAVLRPAQMLHVVPPSALVAGGRAAHSTAFSLLISPFPRRLGRKNGD